jgi:hypothetical protein
MLICILTLSQFLAYSLRVGRLENEIDYLKTVVIEMQSSAVKSSQNNDLRAAGMSIEQHLIEASYD